MINNIIIDGYKCLKDKSIATGKLNVLVGTNGSGKSSLLQTLLLLRQSADKSGGVENLHLSGPLYEAGTAQDAFHPAAEHQIKFELLTDEFIAERHTATFLFRQNRDDIDRTKKRLLPAVAPQTIPPSLNSRSNGFAYLNAERVGPRVVNALPPDEVDISGLVGKYGEYTAAVLARAASDEIFVEGWNEELISRFATPPMQLDGIALEEDLNNTGGRLDLVCNKMLGWILPGNEFQAKVFDDSDAATVRYIRDPLGTRTEVRATHNGFGLTYTLPIITAALALREDGLLIVENPEAHLHPFSQSRIGVFLAMIADTGRQIFVETHSDHVINGIRLATSRKYINANDVYINFFSRQIKSSTSVITQIRPEQNGRLQPWPMGFFDQLENDLSKL